MLDINTGEETELERAARKAESRRFNRQANKARRLRRNAEGLTATKFNPLTATPPWAAPKTRPEHVLSLLKIIATREGFRQPRKWASERLVGEDMGEQKEYGTKYTGEIDDTVSVVIHVLDRVGS
jgi:hypothetical protein